MIFDIRCVRTSCLGEIDSSSSSIGRRRELIQTARCCAQRRWFDLLLEIQIIVKHTTKKQYSVDWLITLWTMYENEHCSSKNLCAISPLNCCNFDFQSAGGTNRPQITVASDFKPIFMILCLKNVKEKRKDWLCLYRSNKSSFEAAVRYRRSTWFRSTSLRSHARSTSSQEAMWCRSDCWWYCWMRYCQIQSHRRSSLLLFEVSCWWIVVCRRRSIVDQDVRDKYPNLWVWKLYN